MPYVDFSEHSDLIPFDKLTVLEAPHRIADAIFRDSLLNDTLFRLTNMGREITNATPRNATNIFRYSPTSLLFGMWDSTGPKGGLGSKFQRAYVSEIVGYDVEIGTKVGSRIDPLAIERLASDDLIYKSNNSDEVWTFDSSEAIVDKKGNPDTSNGQPSNINHGNIPPTLDSTSGGVTISKAQQSTLISFATLRQLRFVGYDREAEVAARCAIAALGLAAIAYQYERDFDLRSRCLLVPIHSLRLEIVKRDGSNGDEVSIDRNSAAELLTQASEKSKSAGIAWETNEIRFQPAPKLIELLRRSQRVSKSEQPQV